MKISQFIHETDFNDLPQDVRNQARRCLLDTIGAGISGRKTILSKIIHDFAASVFGGSGAYLWLDGREVSPPGATIVPILSATLSLKHKANISGKEFLTIFQAPCRLSMVTAGRRRRVGLAKKPPPKAGNHKKN